MTKDPIQSCDRTNQSSSGQENPAHGATAWMNPITPFPWRWLRENPGSDTTAFGMPVCKMDGDENIIVGHGNDWGPSDPRGDAELICQAVNALADEDGPLRTLLRQAEALCVANNFLPPDYDRGCPPPPDPLPVSDPAITKSMGEMLDALSVKVSPATAKDMTIDFHALKNACLTLRHLLRYLKLPMNFV